jgi:hypothetical protein
VEALQQSEKPRFKVVVDAAHFFPQTGAGAALAHLDEWEAYVISAHKWLLCPEPCGILISSRSRRDGVQFPFDAWHRKIPMSTASARMLAGLKASLEVIREIGPKEYERHSRDHRSLFLHTVRERFRTVDRGQVTWGLDGNRYLSPFCAIEPTDDFCWASDDFCSTTDGHEKLRGQLSDVGVNVEVLNVEPGNPWLRVSFPFFINESHVRDGCRQISNLVKRKPR